MHLPAMCPKIPTVIRQNLRNDYTREFPHTGQSSFSPSTNTSRLSGVISRKDVGRGGGVADQSPACRRNWAIRNAEEIVLHNGCRRFFNARACVEKNVSGL